MNVRFAAVLVAAALALLPAAVRADSFDPISIGVHAGTLGYGVTLERPLLFDLSARIETGNMSLTQGAAIGGIPSVETQHFANVLAALEWRPQALRFGISAGLLFGSDHTDYLARQDLGAYTINGSVYPVAAAGQIATRVSFDQPGLYFGIGTNTGIARGLAIAFNAGIVIRNGSVQTSASGPAAQTAALQRDLLAQNGQYRTRVVSPAISLGLTYRP
jgi:hypothetical protein